MSYDLILDDVLEGGPTEAEQEVIDACTAGLTVELGQDRPKDGSDRSRVIRAALIRHLMRGGCKQAPVGDVGPILRGAWIAGKLDLEHLETGLALQCRDCVFDTRPVLLDTRLYGLALERCRMPGLAANRLYTRGPVGFRQSCFDGALELEGAHIGAEMDLSGAHLHGRGADALAGSDLSVVGSLHLRSGFSADGRLMLYRARVGGLFNCSAARCDGNGKEAIMAQRMRVDESVFLRKGFSAIGSVDLHAVQIGGQLSCAEARFVGTLVGSARASAIRLQHAHIGQSVFFAQASDQIKTQIIGDVDMIGAAVEGNLRAEGLRMSGAVRASHLLVRDTLFLAGGSGKIGLHLADASVGVLREDAAFWERVSVFNLSGFTYDRLIGDRGVAERLAWLEKKSERRFRGRREKQFDPQPYTQLAAAYEAQGDRAAAQRVLCAREGRLLRAAQERALARADGSWAGARQAFLPWLRQPLEWLFGLVFGYGHQPARAVWVVLAIWIGAALFYNQTYAAGQMAPNSAVILTSEHWLAAVASHCPQHDAAGVCTQPPGPMPLDLWRLTPPAQDYETFNAALYALDVFLPLDALGQERAWAPSPARGAWGQMGFVLRPLLQFAGWVITAVAAAAVTGVIGRKE